MAMTLARPRGCPRHLTNVTARVARTTIRLVTSVARDDKPSSRAIACAMKLPPLLRSPDAIDDNLTARGSRAPNLASAWLPKQKTSPEHEAPDSRATLPPSFPSGEATPTARVTCTVERARRLGYPKRRLLAPLHRLLERWNRSRRPVARPTNPAPLR